MRTTISAVVFLIFCNFTFAGESIPTPIFYKLSKHLLTETQHFVDGGETKVVKKSKSKVDSAGTLKCQPKQEQEIKKIGLFILGTPQSLWKIDNDNRA